MNFIFGDKPGCSSLHNAVSFVAITSIVTLVYTCFAKYYRQFYTFFHNNLYQSPDYQFAICGSQI